MPDDAFGYFVTKGLDRTIEVLLQCKRVAAERGLEELASGVSEVIAGLLADVKRVAIEIAGTADGAIIRKMFETQAANRPLTGVMETHVVSAAGPLGSVRVALMSELDKIVNPNGYGTFWRAQEYGTGGEGGVPTQIGRTFLGTFQPSGEAPDAAQRGLGAGRDAAFVSGGANPGRGMISVDLPARHFLRDGTILAGEAYVAAMEGVQTKWDARIHELMGEAKRTLERGTRYTRIIEA